jgi:hypothetical protein
MRQMDDAAAPAARAQFVGVVFERLPLPFDVVENPDLRPDPLRNPDRHGVGLGAGAANVEEQFDRQQRIGDSAMIRPAAGFRRVAWRNRRLPAP